MITTKTPRLISTTPIIKVKPITSPKNSLENKRPKTGTPSIAVEIEVLDKYLLTPLTAQKQNAVASGPR